MPEPTALALPGAPCRGCGRPCHRLDLTSAGFCQRCGLAILRRACMPIPSVVLVYRGELVDDA
jgi:hypothetical protein